MPTKLVLGLQHGDEGKGRIVDDIVQNWAQVIVRFQGGGNAGHTVYDESGNKYVTHLLPVGVLSKDKYNIITKGCVVNIIDLVQEIIELKVNETSLSVSKLCPIIEPLHILKDKLKYQCKIGTTAKGIGPTYSDYYARDAILLKDFLDNVNDTVDLMSSKLELFISNCVINSESVKLFDDARKQITFYRNNAEYLKDFIQKYALNNELILHQLYDSEYNILLEGAQGSGLSINTNNYPNVTSSYPTIGGALNSTNLNIRQIDEVIGVIKSYKTKVGSGDFPSICDKASGDILADIGQEYGATTGRPRQCGWLDIDEVVEAAMINGVDHMCVVKTDVLKELDNPFVYLKGTNVKINKINDVDHTIDQSFKELLETIKIKTKVKNISYTTGPKRGQIVWNAM